MEQMENNTRFQPAIRVAIRGVEKFFGPGIALLLELIGETGSVKEACRRMELSYTKGWTIINRAEQELGFALIRRNQGGKEGGSSSLTEEGREWVAKYRAYEKDVKDYAESVFESHF